MQRLTTTRHRSLLFAMLLVAPWILAGCSPEDTFKAWAINFVGVFQAHPFSLIFFCLFICGVGVPMPEEFFLIMAGYTAFKTGNHWAVMSLVTMVAILAGDSLTYWMGRILRGRITSFWLFRKFISEDLLDRSTEFLSKNGNRTIFAARFMPGIRMPTYLMSGVLGLRYSVFLLYDGLASIISVPIQVFLSWRYGKVLESAIESVMEFNRMLFFSIIAIGLLLYLYSHFAPSRRAKLHSQRIHVDPETGEDSPPPLDLPD